MISLSLLILFLPLVYLVFIKLYLHQTITLKEWLINFGATAAIVFGVVQLSYSQMTHDIMVVNGEVTGKHQDKVDCDHSYSCDCDSEGHCSTCYEHPYDFEWVVDTTVGKVVLNNVDRQGKTMPSRYNLVVMHEPAALEKSYVNYVKAVPDSLFNDEDISNITLETPLPDYPRVHDYYRFNRVIDEGTLLTENTRHLLNRYLNEGLKTLGGKKEVNIVLVFTNYPQGHEYKTALKRAWINGKKNDVVIVVGTENGKEINYVQSFGWSLKEMVHTALEGDLSSLKLETDENIKAFSEVVLTNIDQYFERDEMKNYEYLKDSIDPPTWVIVLALVLGFIVAIGGSYYFHKNDGVEKLTFVEYMYPIVFLWLKFPKLFSFIFAFFGKFFKFFIR